MTDSPSASRSASPSTGPAPGPAAAGAGGASPRADEARHTIDASRQAGVVNPEELAKDLAQAYAQDPQAGAELHTAVREQLSERDQASLDGHLDDLSDHLGATLGAVASTTTASRGPVDASTVTVYRVEGQGNQRVNIGADGAVDIPSVPTNKGRGPERNLYLNFGDEARAQQFLQQRLQQFPDNTVKTFEVPRSYVHELRASAVPESQRSAHPERPVVADPTKARDQFGLSGPQIDKLRDVTVQGSGNRPTAAPSHPGALRAAGQGALVSAATDAALTAAGALRDGRINRSEAQDILTHSARGAVVGGTYAVTEQGLVRVADRAIGHATERGAASLAAKVGAADAGLVGATTRTVVTRLGGAGAAGAAISAGFSIYQNREALAQGDSNAIGRVAGDVVVGAGAALSGAAAGAAIGSVVPVVGTAVGAVVGLGVGFAADYVMRAGGVDKAVGNLVSSGVDAAKSAASKVAGWLGW